LSFEIFSFCFSVSILERFHSVSEDFSVSVQLRFSKIIPEKFQIILKDFIIPSEKMKNKER